MSSPEDVCHKQFGARTAFKLVWCEGTGVAALIDDWGNVLSSGKPLPPDGGEVPMMGGARARQGSWQVLSHSHNHTWAERWRETCKVVTSGVDRGAVHDEL